MPNKNKKTVQKIEWLMSYSRVKAFATTHGFTTIEVGTVFVTLEKMSGKNPSKRQTLFKPKKNAKEWQEALIQLMQETTN